MRRLAVPITAMLVGTAVVALLAFGLVDKATSSTLDDAVARARYPPAPASVLPLLSGDGTRSLAAYRGQVVVLNFWASWCLPCQAEAPMLERAQRVLRQHRATVLGVTFRDATPDAQSFVRQYGLTYPQLRDVTGTFASRYGTDQLPESFIIDRQGRVRAISRGQVVPSFLNRAEALAEGS